MTNFGQGKAGFFKLISGRLYALLLVTAMLLTLACSKQGDTGLSGTVVDTTGKQVSKVTITCGSITGTSSSDGSFSLALKPGSEQIVMFSSPGFIPCSWRVNVYKGHMSVLPIKMMPRTGPKTIDAGAGGTASGPHGATLTTPPNAFVDKSGAPVSGTVDVSLTPLDPAKPEEAAAYPGELRGFTADGKTVPLITYGVLDIVVTKNGEPLQVAPGKTVDIAIPAPSAGTPPDTTPLWYYDEKQAQWIQVDGEAKYDAATNTFNATVSHLTSYNADRAMDPSCVNGMVKDAQGKPVVGATVTAQQGYKTDAHYSRGVYALTHTDENGNFCLTAEREEPVLLTVTDTSGNTTTRTFTANATRSKVYPADCSQSSCLQLKTIVINTDDPGQDTGKADCNYDATANPFFGTCAQGLGDFYVCFHPEGACYYRMDYGLTSADMNYEMSFENGARVEFTTDVFGGSTISYYGPSPFNKLCGTMSGNSEQTVITTESGQTYTMIYDKSGAVSVVCPGGYTIALDGAQKDALTGCNGNIGNAGSKGTGGGVTCQPAPGSFMSKCTFDSDCDTGYQCCGQIGKDNSKCVPPDMCEVLEGACSSDYDCLPLCYTEDNCMTQVCCSMGFFDICMPKEYCQ